MAIEIEAKFRLDKPEALRQRLRELSADRIGAALETNRFFDWPDARLRNSDCGLRIRTCQALDDAGSVTAGGKVTYKGPREPGEMKRREEVEFTADDPQAAAEVLAGIGLVGTMTFQKRRESWLLDGCLVEVDELPGLGYFVEVEGPNEEAVRATAERLGLSAAMAEREPYTALLDKYCAEHGLSGREISF